MSDECPKCKVRGKVGIISCFRFEDMWVATCGNKDCDYVLPHNRSRNLPVETDRRKHAHTNRDINYAC